MLYLEFKDKRLCVGFRRRDWSKVWYQPIGKADNDGTAVIGLFSTTTGMQTREPMEGEVAWLPHFELTTFESKLKRERDRMQMQFINDTYRYMNEPDEDALPSLDRKLNQPNYSRWQTWFAIVKAEKRQRIRRRGRRQNTALQAGIALADVHIESDASDNPDECDEAGSSSLMGPPLPTVPIIRSAGQKRRAAGSRNPAAKRTKITKNSRPANSGSASRVDGTLPSRETGCDDYPGSGYEDEDGDLFDARPPEASRSGSANNRADSLYARDIGNILGHTGHEASTGKGNGNGNGRIGGPRQPFQEDHETGEDDPVAREFNGGMDEEAAIQQAMRASMPPGGCDEHPPQTNSGRRRT